MRIDLGDVTLWFDVSGPSVVARGETAVERPTLVAVHGGPGLDHINLKAGLAPLTGHLQVLFYDQRGHGRSDHSTAEFWNLRAWAGDLRRLCDALGLARPVVLGSSFGGFVALTYAGLFPDHPGGIILANTTGGRSDHPRSVEIFRRLGGDEAAAVAERDFTELTEESAAEFNRVCYPLYSSKPGYAEESRQRLARSIQTIEVNLHYFRYEAPRFDPWSVLAAIRCPVLILAGEDDPVCPLPVVEDLAGQLPAGTTRLVCLPGARHTIFRDRPDLAFPAIEEFLRHIGDGGPALSAWAMAARQGGEFWQDRGVAFDELDQRIVGALVENARATYSEIGGRVGLSAPAVKRRVDRLRATGAITGFSATVNPAALGWTTEAYVELFCRGRTSPADIGAAVSRYPEVTGAATITGEADALLHIRAADVRHFERVVERISAEPFVVRTRSVIVLSRLVSRAGFPPPGPDGPGIPGVPGDSGPER